MYFAAETFAGHPGLEQTVRLEENLLVTKDGPGDLHQVPVRRGGPAANMRRGSSSPTTSAQISEIERLVLASLGPELVVAAATDAETLAGLARGSRTRSSSATRSSTAR